jgi:hypothetical protein
MITLCATDCGRPIPDTTYVCPSCGDRLQVLLTLVPGILNDLEDVVRRQVRFTTGTSGKTSERPLPYNPAAAESRTVLTGTLTFWAASVAEIRGVDLPDDLPGFLSAQVGWLRAQATGAEAFDELTSAIVQARRVTDRPADKRYAGPCTALVEAGECRTDLYARDTGDSVTCRECGTEYPLTERRAWLLEQAEDRLLPAAEMARAVDGLGVPVSAATIASWKRRGRITVHPGPGVDLFRVGDVRALVEANARRRGDVA